MRVVGLYRRGPAWRDELPLGRQPKLEQHLAHVGELHRGGAVGAAGPFHALSDTVDDELVGLVVFTTDSVDEARAQAERDPAVASGLMRVELRPWFG